jgi:predicted DNA-binding transcriptional regulator AlpA
MSKSETQETFGKEKKLTMAEASELSGMSVQWLYLHMRKNTLPFPWS